MPSSIQLLLEPRTRHPGRNAPPARYTLESDSEEEFDPEDNQQAEGGSRTASTSKRPEPVVSLELANKATGLDVVVAIEEAGRSWAEGLDASNLVEDGSVSVNEQKVGFQCNADDAYTT